VTCWPAAPPASAKVIAEVNAGVVKGFGQVDLVATAATEMASTVADCTQRDPDLARDPAGHRPGEAG
jgi:hypothetical protein